MKIPITFLAGLFMFAALPAYSGQPAQPTTSTDPNHCTWHWLTGGGLGVWTEKCKFDTGVWHLKYDAAHAGFFLYVDEDDLGVVLAPFAKAADAGIEGVLPALKQRGLIPDDNDCAFQPASAEVVASLGPTPRTRAFFEIMPIGKRKEAFDATPEDEVPEPPCGEAGFDPDGIRLFMTDITHPTGVVYMNLGQDGTMFEPRSVTWEGE